MLKSVRALGRRITLRRISWETRGGGRNSVGGIGATRGKSNPASGKGQLQGAREDNKGGGRGTVRLGIE